jgi:exonuclease SbcC
VKIEVVLLENIRSHVKSTVPFARGFNCLVGGLGCGKSTILYSIDFALFGDPIGRSYEYLLREGADDGKVTLHFAQNGKSYRIVRGLRKRGKGISQDADELELYEDDTLLSSVKTDAVAEQLKAITGLDKELFREIVWVRQEHLKELLDSRPRERQTRLDELFGFSDYEVAWSNLSGYSKLFEGEKRAYERDSDVVGIGKLGQEYNRTVEEFSTMEIELEKAREQLTVGKRALEEADLRLKKLEEVRTNIERLKLKEAKAQADLSNAEKTSAMLMEKIEARKDAVQKIKQRLDAMVAQIETHRSMLPSIGFSVERPIDALKQYLATLDVKISDLKGEQEAALRSIREDQNRISSLEAESRCPLCLQSLTDEYKEELTRKIHGENSVKQQEVDQILREIEATQQMKSKADSVSSQLQNLMPRIDELKTRMNNEFQMLAGMSEELDEREKTAKNLREQLGVLQAEMARLDISGLEIAKTQKNEALEQFYKAGSELTTKEGRRKEMVKRMDELKDRIDLAQQKIERVEKIAKIIELVGNIRDAYRNIQPKLRREFIEVLRNFVQQVLDSLAGGEGQLLNILIDETYTPYVKSESGVVREVSHLSGGERTLLALAYRLGLGQLIMQSKTGHGLTMLLLDEPTESLGREDGSIDRLAEAISRFKAIEQIIAVTHSEAFAEKAEHVIRLEKEADVSRVLIEK